MGARLHAMHLLPQLRALDGAPVTPAERLAAANMHGAEAEGLSAIRRKHFPDGELDDGGGAIPPTAAGAVPRRRVRLGARLQTCACLRGCEVWLG